MAFLSSFYCHVLLLEPLLYNEKLFFSTGMLPDPIKVHYLSNRRKFGRI